MDVLNKFILKSGEKIEITSKLQNETFETYADKMFNLLQVKNQTIMITSADNDEYLTINVNDIAAHSVRTV